MTNVYLLNAHANMSVEEALSYTLKENLKQVLIIGMDGEDELHIRSSSMCRKDALWLLELAKKHTLPE